MTARPSALAFLKAFWADWGERMSGPASVPLMIAALFIPDRYVAIGTGVLGIACGIFAAYRVWSNERNRVLDLEKISRVDLQRMLNGMFMGNTFMLGGEINLCKQYKGKFALDQLCVNYDRVEARAPGGAVARIRFKLNARREWSAKAHVIVRDGLGQVERVENIYEPMSILLGDNGEFFVKLERDESVVFEDGTELWVDLETWTK
ncbi:hypothetical protein HNR60_000837 [Rhodopseudomonas rhenobacensis]|uniref:Uncharacterized protein n=1 Tax=Rhodopseudomonas rhenobacensis TaxID=87461 RepID=A0A7W7Z1J5_9BRAD|nr:hypothetical protein [Rhodopseudomonas rhenobacensis]MBB5046095.1 hypothetical protein [Rhodopseudomonas rhenobacensis]